MEITKRKQNHLQAVLETDVTSDVTNGFERYRLIHEALPEEDFDAFSTDTAFLGKTVSAPIMIDSMTGGSELGEKVNRNLAMAAAALNIPLAVGSERVYLEHPEKPLCPYRQIAPNVPLMANLGAVQLNYGFTRDHCLRAVELIGADALVLHLNPLQELLQQGGDRNFSGLLRKVEAVCRDLPVPVIIKEVGWGIRAETAGRLRDAGAAMINIAGAGGTSWSKVESAFGTEEEVLLSAPFADWGIPTAECLVSIHKRFPDLFLIASGGLRNGVEAAKAVRLGAGICGFAGALLPAAVKDGPEPLIELLTRIIRQYRIAMFVSSGIEPKKGPGAEYQKG